MRMRAYAIGQYIMKDLVCLSDYESRVISSCHMTSLPLIIFGVIVCPTSISSTCL